MLAARVVLLRTLGLVCSGHRAVALKNLAFRQQLAVFKRTTRRPPLHRRYRLFWVLQRAKSIINKIADASLLEIRRLATDFRQLVPRDALGRRGSDCGRQTRTEVAQLRSKAK
jgi:hypothetical protein